MYPVALSGLRIIGSMRSRASQMPSEGFDGVDGEEGGGDEAEEEEIGEG